MQLEPEMVNVSRNALKEKQNKKDTIFYCSQSSGILVWIYLLNGTPPNFSN